MSDPNRYLALVRSRTVFKDGAMGTQIQDAKLDDAAYGGYPGNVDHLTLSAPDVIRNIHRAYLDAGADYVITNSFQSTRLRLEEWGLGDQTLEHNRAAAALAREMCDEFATAGWPRFVAGSIGPTGMLPSGNDPTLSAHHVPRAGRDCSASRPSALLEGGVDLLLIETMQDILETQGGHRRHPRARSPRPGRRVPLQAQVDARHRPAACCSAPTSAPSLRRSRHCRSTSSASTARRARSTCASRCATCAEHCDAAVVVIPNAGLPLNVGRRARLSARRRPSGRAAGGVRRASSASNVVGGCCGTTPEHIRQLRRAPSAAAPRSAAPAGVPAGASPRPCAPSTLRPGSARRCSSASASTRRARAR